MKLFKAITQAYNVLSNEEKRRAYDLTLTKKDVSQGVNLTGEWIRPVIYENIDVKKDSQSPFNFTTLRKEEISFNYFEPNYMTFYPNSSYPFYDDEPIWIMPGLNFDFIWDFTLSPEQNTSK